MFEWMTRQDIYRHLLAVFISYLENTWMFVILENHIVLYIFWTMGRHFSDDVKVLLFWWQHNSENKILIWWPQLLKELTGGDGYKYRFKPNAVQCSRCTWFWWSLCCGSDALLWSGLEPGGGHSAGSGFWRRPNARHPDVGSALCHLPSQSAGEPHKVDINISRYSYPPWVFLYPHRSICVPSGVFWP